MEHTRYIARKRARFVAMCGPVNIPYGTPLEERDGILYSDPGKPVCYAESQNGEEFFCSDDDGRGRERGALLNAILSSLERHDAKYQNRWDTIWGSPVCMKYRRMDRDDFWLWSHELYCAPVKDLQIIANLIGAVPAKG